MPAFPLTPVGRASHFTIALLAYAIPTLRYTSDVRTHKFKHYGKEQSKRKRNHENVGEREKQKQYISRVRKLPDFIFLQPGTRQNNEETVMPYERSNAIQFFSRSP